MSLYHPHTGWFGSRDPSQGELLHSRLHNRSTVTLWGLTWSVWRRSRKFRRDCAIGAVAPCSLTNWYEKGNVDGGALASVGPFWFGAVERLWRRTFLRRLTMSQWVPVFSWGLSVIVCPRQEACDQ